MLPELSSDDEGPEDMDKSVKKKSKGEDDEEGSTAVSDFDLMLMKKKEEMGKRRRKRKDVDIINDNDDLIADLINRMKQAAQDDRECNMKKLPATRKIKMLPEVMSQLKKKDLQIAFLDQGVLNGITEWLAPLPDKSLPHLNIREFLLRCLIAFPEVSSESLKMSGIGKAVMYLYKHPKEIRTNKEMAGKLINSWSRPIFNLTANYKSLSREEREQRDYAQLPKKRRISAEAGMTPRRDIDKALAGEQKQLRPGDPGWVGRARVPAPSNKDYVVRPKWNIEENLGGSKRSVKKALNRYEKKLREHKEAQKKNKSQRAVTISIEGRNMAL